MPTNPQSLEHFGYITFDQTQSLELAEFHKQQGQKGVCFLQKMDKPQDEALIKNILSNKGQMYEQLYPYQEEQKLKSEMLIQRLSAWKPVFKRTEEYFNAQRHTHDVMAKETEHMMKVFGDLKGSALELGDSTVAASVIDSMAKKHQVTAQNIKEHLIKALHDMKHNHHKNIKHFHSEITRILQEVRKERKQTLDLLSTHLKHFQSVKINKTSDKHSVDPWLTQQAVNTQIRHMVRRENENRQQFRIVIQDVRQYENELVRGMFQLMHQFCSIENVHSQEVTRIADQLAVMAPSLERSFEQYGQKFNITDGKCFNHELSVADFAYPNTNQDSKGVQLEAVFLRPGTVRKGVYRPSLFVLTVNGFLHCYRMKSSQENIDYVKQDPERILYSLYLRTPRTEIIHSLKNIDCVEISVPNPSLFNKNQKEIYLFKTDSTDTMNTWLTAMQEFLASNRDRPEVEE